jgi:serine/threonine protein kinase/tetratricopeptide (TPR) repeat protein
MIEPDRHARIGDLLVAALDRPAGDRGRYLEETCRGDEGLRREVEALLDAHHRAGDFLETPILLEAGPKAVQIEVRKELENRSVGPYRLLEPIGRGGMGIVYRASRSDRTFEKTVAIKLVKRGMDTEEIVRRFEKERRILAGLDHPNIARVLDGGTTEDGLPYLVMEYVDGLPILEFCDARRLSTADRLRLFLEVCSAVQFAHRHLVVHRDLKPSNILVDAASRPRLLDFGIAKILAPDDASGQTATGVRPMTPRYSSPEQIRGEPIHTSSDVYSLGVLLYELLSGRSPYRTSGSASDMERAVCEEEPERPSAAVARPEPATTPEGETPHLSLASLEYAREGDARKLRRRLAGDLDTIVLLSLQKDPRRRYASVEQLAEDIRRHLSGLPIRARSDTLLYRSGKFVRRHAIAVGAAAVFVILAAGATVTMAIQRQRIDRERLRAEQTSAFVLGLFKGADPTASRGATLTARELLDRGRARILRDLSNQPEVQAALMDNIGGVYRELGLFDQARQMIEGAYSSRLRIFGETSLAVAESRLHMGELEIAMGRFADAEVSLRESLALRRRLLGNQSLGVAEVLETLGRVLHRRGQDQAAEPMFRSALSIQTSLVGERGLAVANSWHSLGATLASLGDYDEAEAALRKALDIGHGSDDPDNPSITSFRNDLGIVLMAKGKFKDATALYREASESRRRIVGDEHVTYAAVLANLAAALDLDGYTEEAEVLSRKALGIARRSLGDDHPTIGFAWNNLATILRTKGDRAGAQDAASRALTSFKANLPPGHMTLSGPLITLGWARTDAGRPQEGEPLLRQAVEIRTKALKPGDWRIAEAESYLGSCLAAQRRFEEAAALLRQSFDIQGPKLGAGNRQTIRSLRELVAVYEAWGNPDRARFYRTELEAARKTGEAGSSL